MFTVLTVPGLGEALSLTSPNTPQGMLALYTNQLPTSTYQSRQFNYRNSYGPLTGDPLGTSYDENLVDAVETLAAEIDRDPNPVILFGYSGGAQVVSILLDEIRAGLRPTLVVPAAVLIANPIRHLNDPPRNYTYGVAGMHGEFPPNTHVIHVNNPCDIICCSEQNSPIRGISNISKSFSFTDPQAWGAKYIRAAVEGKAQNWWNPFVRGAWGRAIAGALGYLDGSQHRDYYTNPTIVNNTLAALTSALAEVNN